MIRPCSTAPTMVAKLSSVMTMAAASLATSVPLTPIAMPMSACFSAGASFTPSPVIATTSPPAWRASTIRSLCSGETRANTPTSAATFCQPSASRSASSRPWAVRSGRPWGSRSRPSCRPISAAVASWSPVIITVRMPATRHVSMAALASSRSGSIMPTSPTNTKPLTRSSSR